MPRAASTAIIPPAVPAAIENTVCCPARVDSGGTLLAELSLPTMVTQTNMAVSSIAASSSHSHSRVPKSLRNSAAIRRRISAHLLQGGVVACEREVGLFEVAAF